MTDPFAAEVNAVSHKARAAKKEENRFKQMHDGMKVEEQNGKRFPTLCCVSVFVWDGI